MVPDASGLLSPYSAQGRRPCISTSLSVPKWQTCSYLRPFFTLYVCDEL